MEKRGTCIESAPVNVDNPLYRVVSAPQASPPVRDSNSPHAAEDICPTDTVPSREVIGGLSIHKPRQRRSRGGACCVCRAASGCGVCRMIVSVTLLVLHLIVCATWFVVHCTEFLNWMVGATGDTRDWLGVGPVTVYGCWIILPSIFLLILRSLYLITCCSKRTASKAIAKARRRQGATQLHKHHSHNSLILGLPFLLAHWFGYIISNRHPRYYW